MSTGDTRNYVDWDDEWAGLKNKVQGLGNGYDWLKARVEALERHFFCREKNDGGQPGGTPVRKADGTTNAVAEASEGPLRQQESPCAGSTPASPYPPAPGGEHDGCRHHPDQDCPKGAGEKRWSVYVCATCGRIRNFSGDDRCTGISLPGEPSCEKWIGTKVVPAADLDAEVTRHGMTAKQLADQGALNGFQEKQIAALRDKLKEAETLASVRLEEHDRQMKGLRDNRDIAYSALWRRYESLQGLCESLGASRETLAALAPPGPEARESGLREAAQEVVRTAWVGDRVLPVPPNTDSLFRLRAALAPAGPEARVIGLVPAAAAAKTEQQHAQEYARDLASEKAVRADCAAHGCMYCRTNIEKGK